MDGNLIKTLYATKFTANGGYKNRPDSLALWVEKSDLASMSKSEVDAITGATPGNGTHSYVWDLTGADGETVPPGTYTIAVEGTLRWKNAVTYIGAIKVGDEPDSVQLAEGYVYEASDQNGALKPDSPENHMIENVTARFDLN